MKTSQYRGIRITPSGKWQAMIKVKQASIYLGNYADENAAARMYDSAALHFFGQSAALNFPNETPMPYKPLVTTKVTRKSNANTRFWLQVEKTDTCWIWKGSLTGGYGQIRHDGKRIRAHRFSYQQLVGSIPNGMQVCHRCDNPTCVNPAHLWIGTHDDNMKDMSAKKRYKLCDQKGESHSQAKITEENVRSIRQEYETGNIPQTAIAQKYGITRSQVSHIVHRRSWAHVD